MDVAASLALITFVKNPRLGEVKTRLAQTMGEHKALQIYLALLDHTRQVCEQVPAQRYLYYSQFIDRQDNWPNDRFHKAIQPPGDLGTRMATAFETVLQQHQKAIIIGSDCATLRPEIITLAFAKLDTADFVLGPALDGGYYLLGMRQFTRELFTQMPWSTPEVADITRHRIHQLGYSLAEVDQLSDIDYETDWLQYGWPL